MQEIGVVFEVDSARMALAVEFGRETDAGVEFVAAGIIENCYIPAHVHVAGGIGPGINHNKL